VRRARHTAEQADLVLWLVDPVGGRAEVPVVDGPVWRVATKADVGVPAGRFDLAISAKVGTGLDDLEDRLRQAASAGLGSGAALVTRERQRVAIQDALACLEQISGADEEIAADLLRSASDAIGRLTGRVGIEQVLDRVFREFCIGK
jgi:tRNA modification GTPase